MFGGKRAIVLMMFAMLLTLFSGCSPSSSDSGQTELKIWTHPFLGGEKLNNQEDEFWKKVIAEFEKKHPGVKVNLQVLPWGNREEKILTAISSNSGPDVFYAIPDMMVDYKAKGILAPMDEYLDKNDLRDFNDNALAAARHEGKLYGLPILQSVVTNYYNVDLLKEIGANPDDLPETWDELIALGPKLKEKKKFLLNFEGGGSPNERLYPWLWQAGGDVVDEQGNVMINSAEAKKTYQLIYDMYKKGYISKDSPTAANTGIQEFLAGKLAVFIGPNNFAAIFKDQPPEFEWKLGPILKDKEQATFGTTGFYVIPGNSKNKELAAEFIKLLTNKENMSQFCKMAGYIPPRKSAADLYKGDPVMEMLVEQSKLTRPGVLHPVARQIIPAVKASYQQVMTGKASVDQALSELEKSIRQTIEQNGS